MPAWRTSSDWRPSRPTRPLARRGRRGRGRRWSRGRVVGSRRRRRRRRPRRSPAPRFVEEAAAAGVDHAYDGELRVLRRRRRGGLRLRRRRPARALPRRRQRNPAALFRNASPIGGALRFEPLAEPGDRPDRRHRRLPARHRRRRRDRPGRPAARRERPPARARRLPLRARQRGLGHSTAATSGRPPSAPRGSAGAALPTLAFGNYLTLDATDDRAEPAPTTSSFRPAAATAAATRRPTPLAPGWCTLSMLFSDWDRSGRRDLRVTNDRHYYSDGRRGAALADRRRASRRGCTRATTAGGRCGSGAWASPART